MQAIISPMHIPDEARRVVACLIGAEGRTGTLAHEAVSAIEFNLLSRGWPVGEALGSLSYFQSLLGLGRPAYREAITILEARGLLDIRRGPGGGLFVAAPTLDDVVGSMLLYLAISGASRHCVRDFRLEVWRMIVEAAIQRRISTFPPLPASEWGFAFDLAKAIGNPAMILAAQLAERLVRVCEGRPAPARDVVLDAALKSRDLARACGRIEILAGEADLAAPVLALEMVERGLAWSRRKCALALAARMARELCQNGGALEAEWETAERLGYSDAAVRQARRILQDFGVVNCRQGRKGAVWGAPASPAGVIRLLAPCLAVAGVTPRDNSEAAYFLASSAPRLAARRTRDLGAAAITLLAPGAGSCDMVDVLRVENMLLELGGNPLLTILVRSLGLANLVSQEITPSLTAQADMNAFNRRILQAIESGDPDAAAGLARAKGRAMQATEERHRRVA